MYKKFILLSMLMACQFAAFTQSGAPCLREGIIFSTQASVDSFRLMHPNCFEIEGTVLIEGENIHNLYGLSSIYQIDGDLMIYWTSNLRNLRGLDSLHYINGRLRIMDNPGLLNLWGLGGLAAVGEDVTITYNDALERVSGLGNLQYIGNDLHIANNPLLTSLLSLNALQHIGGNLTIRNCNVLTKLCGLDGLEYVGGRLHITENAFLLSLTGLEHLTTVNEDVWVSFNPILTNLSGLQNLDHVGSGLTLMHNYSLSEIEDLSQLQAIGGDLRIGYNSVLLNLSGLNQLQSIDGNLVIDHNPMLSCLSCLENLDPSSIYNLYIYENNSLCSCEVQAICDFVSYSSNSIFINRNSQGCNSLEEVLAACETTVLVEPGDDASDAPLLTFYPNPCSNVLTMEMVLFHSQKTVLKIYDINARLAGVLLDTQLDAGEHKYIFNLAHLPSGIYFIRMNGDGERLEGASKVVIIKQ